MRVLVLDGNENQAVAAVRSLAAAGHRVLVGASTAWSKAGWSRHCRGTFRYPAPQQDADAFVERVTEVAGREPGTLVLPMTERTTLPLSAQRTRVLAAGGLLVLPSHATILRAFDKQATTELARGLGLRVPETRVITAAEELGALREAIPFPLVLKPRQSEEWSTAGALKATGAPRYARNQAELVSAYAELRQRCSAVLVQEFIPGTGAGYFCVMEQGHPIAEFAHRRIRDVRPTGSGSALRESVPQTPELQSAGRALLGSLGWHGPAMVEFRQSANQSLCFLEINGRFWNSLALAVYAGADFPALLAEIAAGRPTGTSVPYREGVRCRWLLGDLRHLIEVWRGPPAGFPEKYPSRWGTLAQFLRPRRGTFHDNFAWDDPLPELGDWLDFALRRLPKGLRRR